MPRLLKVSALATKAIEPAHLGHCSVSRLATNSDPPPNPAKSEASAPNHSNLKAMVREVGALVTPPHVYMKVWELLQSSESSAKDFERVIGLDPKGMLEAGLIHVANAVANRSSIGGFYESDAAAA